MNRPAFDTPPLLCLALALSLVGPALVGRADEGGTDLKVGILQGGHAYVCGFQSSRDVTLRGAGTLAVLRGGGADKETPTTVLLPLVVASGDKESLPLRWRIAQGKLWVLEFWPVPTGGGSRAGQLVRVPLREGTAARWGERVARGEGEGPVERCGRLEPLDLAFLEASLNQTGPVHFDFLPGPGDRCSLFIRSAGKVLRWGYEFRFSEVHGGGFGEWSPREEWSVDWSEPFYAHADGSGFLFVTESGKVFAAKTKEKGGKGKVKEVWGGRRPLVALVINADSGTAFAFGRDFFFDLREEITPTECHGIVAPGSGGEQAVRTIINCRQVLSKTARVR